MNPYDVAAAYNAANNGQSHHMSVNPYDMAAAAAAFHPQYFIHERTNMRTALHIWKPKTLDYWHLPESEQKKRPYFLGYDYITNPLVAFGTPCQDIQQPPPLPTHIPVLLPDQTMTDYGLSPQGNTNGIIGNHSVTQISPHHQQMGMHQIQTNMYPSPAPLDEW